MPILQGVVQYNKNKYNSIKGYRIALNTTGIAKTGFKQGDELDVKYQKGKITITKRN